MKITDIITEAIPTGSRADLYHSTSLHRAFNILKSRRIQPSADGYVSVTRDPRLNYAQRHHDDLDHHDQRSGPPVYVTFAIDQELLRSRSRVEPYNWGYSRDIDDDPKSESEERVRGSVPMSAIVGVIIDKFQIELPRVKKLLAAAKTLGLKIRLA